MLDLPPMRRLYAPVRHRAPLPQARSIRFPSGLVCDARCVYATGPDCDCPCGGVNHGSALRCDLPQQDGLPL